MPESSNTSHRSRSARLFVAGKGRGLDRVCADPALASGTFVTTVTDVVGFFAFLGLASAVLL